jgi:hypothetical protein
MIYLNDLEGGICMVSIYAFAKIGAGVETVGGMRT